MQSAAAREMTPYQREQQRIIDAANARYAQEKEASRSKDRSEAVKVSIPNVAAAVAECKRILPADLISNISKIGYVPHIVQLLQSGPKAVDQVVADRILDLLRTLKTDEELMQAFGNFELLEKRRAEARQRLAEEPERLRKKAILDSKIDEFFASGAISRSMMGQSLLTELEIDAITKFNDTYVAGGLDYDSQDLFHQALRYKNTGKRQDYD